MKPLKMHNSRYNRSIFLLFISGLVRVARSLDYSELEALGVSCPERDKCEGYTHNLGYMDRHCECDPDCKFYGDCCIDANGRSSSLRMAKLSNTVCMNYGRNEHTGVYVVAHCSSNWNGSQQVREKCEGSLHFSDPMSAAPVTNVAQSVTYKNLFCAECNNDDMQSLKTFQFKPSCDGLDDISQAQVIGDLFYDQKRASWGVNRLDAKGNPTFVECDILFDVPDYIRSKVRFCRANVISTCDRHWTRDSVRAKCGEYMAVVYDLTRAYRNPHCAICNYRNMYNIACEKLIAKTSRRYCSPGHKYDPFFKRCRKLVCAIPGHVVVDGRCVPGGS